MFSGELFEISKNTFFPEHLWSAASTDNMLWTQCYNVLERVIELFFKKIKPHNEVQLHETLSFLSSFLFLVNVK